MDEVGIGNSIGNIIEGLRRIRRRMNWEGMDVIRARKICILERCKCRKYGGDTLGKYKHGTCGTPLRERFVRDRAC